MALAPTSAHIGSVLANSQAAQAVWKNTTVSPYDKTIFSAHIQVEKAENGYIVRVARQEGSYPIVHVAKDVAEVNEIITTTMVTFRLEDK